MAGRPLRRIGQHGKVVRDYGWLRGETPWPATEFETLRSRPFSFDCTEYGHQTRRQRLRQTQGVSDGYQRAMAAVLVSVCLPRVPTLAYGTAPAVEALMSQGITRAQRST
jgi:hypothetical protein